jgi:DNA invertase Pin-like site-specific DNA recombinase
VDTSRDIVGYLRVSSSAQSHGQGLQEQRNAIEIYARQAWRLNPSRRIPKERFRIYEERPWSGIAGTADVRPALQTALDDVCGCNGILIVRKIARLANCLADVKAILDRLKDNQCDIVSVGESVSTVFCGRDYAYKVAAQLAEARLRNLIARTTRAAASSKAAGKHWGRVPFGYLKNAAGQLEPHPEQFHIVQEIVQRMDAQETAYCIAKLLNQRLVRTQAGKMWEAKQVTNVYSMFRTNKP